MTDKWRIMILPLLFISLPLSAYTERNLLQKAASLETVKKVMITGQKWVPYPAYSDRSGWEKFLGENRVGLVRNGEQRLQYEWKVVKATDYLEFERSGNRRIMEDPFGNNIQAIVDLLIAELAEGKGRFTDPLINGIFTACEMSSWASSAHLGAAQASGHSLPDNQKQIIDLVSGDFSSLLAWTYYFLHSEFDKVNPVISQRLYFELKRRILDPFLFNHTFWWMAFDYRPGKMVNNWNPWCNFNVLQCFFLLENDENRLAQGIYDSMVSTDKFINYVHSDGACEEGPSYWGHAAGKLYDYLQMLYDGTGGRINLFNEPIVRNMGEYIVRSYVGNNWVVNFADASAKGGGNAPLIFRYGKAIGSPLMTQYAAYLENPKRKNNIRMERDIFRSLQTLNYQKELETEKPNFHLPAATWYPETEFCYMSNAQGLFLAAKGGFNDESHNHNDIGTFSLYVNQTPLFIDAGVGTYTRQTFSTERYSIWTMQSLYHNLPEINGKAQQHGARFKAKDTQFDSKQNRFSLDIAGAYPTDAGVKTWKRTYTLNKTTVNIKDEFAFTKADTPNKLHFLTWGKTDISRKGEVFIEVNGQKVRLEYDSKMFIPSIQTISLTDTRLSNVWGPEIYRLTLSAKKTELSGSYHCKINIVN